MGFRIFSGPCPYVSLLNWNENIRFERLKVYVAGTWMSGPTWASTCRAPWAMPSCTPLESPTRPTWPPCCSELLKTARSLRIYNDFT